MASGTSGATSRCIPRFDVFAAYEGGAAGLSKVTKAGMHTAFARGFQKSIRATSTTLESGGGQRLSHAVESGLREVMEQRKAVMAEAARKAASKSFGWNETYGAGYDAAFGEAPKSMKVGPAGHHVPAVRKSVGRPFEVERSDLSRPTIHVIGNEQAVARAHWRMHNAERAHIGPRQGSYSGTDMELFEAYRQSYKDLTDIRVNVRSPDGSQVLGRNVTLTEAVTLIERFLGVSR